jgi:5-methylthioadenosine/S-adenosylhomocysteine deaminase
LNRKVSSCVVLACGALYDPEKRQLDFDQDLTIEHGSIVSISSSNSPYSKSSKASLSKVQRVDLTDCLVMPGFVNAHSHVAMGFFRGLGHGKKQMIENFLFPSEKSLTEELVGPLSYSMILEGLTKGVTTFLDHYYFSSQIAEAFDEVGVRAWVGETVADLGGAFPGQTSIDRMNKLANELKPSVDRKFSRRINLAVAPHAADTVSTDLMKDLVRFSKQMSAPLHFHLSQTASERKKVLKRERGKSPVQWAFEVGALNKYTLAAHLVSVDKDDIEVFSDSKATWLWCPSSTVIYEKLAPIKKLLQADVNVAIGTDCSVSCDHADVLQEARVAYLFSKDRGVKDSVFGLRDALRCSATSVAPALRAKGQLGTLSKGAFADLAVYPISSSLKPHTSMAENILMSLAGTECKHVMVDGIWRIWNYRFTHPNIKALHTKFDSALRTIHHKVGLS